MKYSTISKIMESVKPGAFTRIAFDTELPLKAAYKKDGYRLIKHTEMTTRFKINYTNLNSYVPSTSGRKNTSFKTLVSNLFYTCKDNIYISTFPCKSGKNTNVSYTLILPNGKKINYDKFYTFNNEDKDLVIDSYWTRSAKQTNYMRININNITKIGK